MARVHGTFVAVAVGPACGAASVHAEPRGGENGPHRCTHPPRSSGARPQGRGDPARLRREATRIREAAPDARDGAADRRLRAGDRRHGGPGRRGRGRCQAYWAAVRIWLEGGDPYTPTGPFLPTFTRRGCCRCSRPGRCYRGRSPGSPGAAATILLLLWSIRWATPCAAPDRHPGRPAGFPLAANLTRATSTCCSRSPCSAPQFTGPRLGRLLWGWRRG